jgi:endoglycosylceramidase
MHTPRPGLIASLSAILALVALGCSDASTDTPAPPETPTSPGSFDPLDGRALPPVQVRAGRLTDAFGREVRLRGVNARIEGVFDVTFDDGRQRLQPIPTFTPEDARQMASVGFNFLRLPINWSGIEPEEGAFNEAYLARVDAVIDACREAGIYVLVDIHQDAWSKHIGEDGAPLWAILPPPVELLEGPLDEEELTRRRVSQPVVQAFHSFWDNVDGLQERWLPMWRLVVTRYGDRPEVVGFQPMNEPVFTGPREAKLHAFYARAHGALREINTHTPLWVEPDAIRNFTLSARVPSEPFLDDNLVYAPHFYPQLVGRQADSVEGWVNQIRESLEAMAREAEAWGNAALVVGEWGADPADPGTALYAEAFHQVMDTIGGGHALWLWKENSQGRWGLFDYVEASGSGNGETWVLREDAARHFGPPMALAVPGRLIEHRFEPATASLTVRFEARGTETAGPLLYLPPSWSPDGYTVLLDNVPVTVTVDLENHRALVPWTRGESGQIELRVTPTIQ